MPDITLPRPRCFNASRQAYAWGWFLFCSALLPCSAGTLIAQAGNLAEQREEKRRPPALERFGGTRETEAAVADGLAWLADHQRSDGVWDRMRFDRHCPEHDRCSQTSLARRDQDCDVGLTSLATLAFLGAGYTHRQGRYAEILERSLEFILARQNVHGGFSRSHGLQLYNDALATLALAEAYALTRDVVLREPLIRAVRRLEQTQHADGAWDYTDDPRSERADSSITGWALMALKAADAAGIRPASITSIRIAGHFNRATTDSGLVWYSNLGTGVRDDPATGRPACRHGPAMTAVGLYARTALGLRGDSEIAARQIDLLLGDPPNLDRMRRDESGLHGEYYWYYGTLAMFNAGGEPWKQWNRSLRTTVLEYQERPTWPDGRKKHAYGSWPAFGRGWGKWGRSGSRIYSTAINVLTLEIYYRYEPFYLRGQGLIGPSEVRDLLRRTPIDEQAKVLKLAASLHPDSAEPLLIELMTARDDMLRLRASLELAALGSPLARDELTGSRGAPAGTDADTRREIDEALTRLPTWPADVQYGRVTAVQPDAAMFLFETGGRRIYYGQPVAVLRDGRPIADATVNRRFSAEQSAAAKWIGEPKEIRVGDQVVAAAAEE